MKSITHLLALAVIILLGATYASAQAPREALAAQAKQNADAMLNKEYETSVRFMYPPVVENMGGFQKTLAFVKKSMADMEAKGWAFESIAIGKPSVIVMEGREDMAIVPTEMVMTVEDKRVRVNSYLVAISQDRGKRWYFFDGAQMPKEKLAQIYPKLATIVDIPERKSTLINEIDDTTRRIEKKEGKPIEQVLDEGLAESNRVIQKIEDNSLRQYIEKREGKRLEQIPTVRLKELLKELKVQ